MTTHEKILKYLKDFAAEMQSKHGMELTVPPPCLELLPLKYVDYEPGERIVAELDFDSRFTNPIGFYQGGFLCAAIDNVFGPLCYMATRSSCVSVDFVCNFVRPFTGADTVLTIDAKVMSKTKSLLVLEARVTNAKSKLVAAATSTLMIKSLTERT